MTLADAPASGSSDEGGVTTRQCAEVVLPREELDRLWSPEYLERLARTYWRFLTQISLGLLRVLYTPSSREVVLVARPLVLLTFHPPEYETDAEWGSVTWRIDRGLLVSPRGRSEGYLRLRVERRDGPREDEAVAAVESEVANFYPLIAGWGWWSRIGRWVYRVTQLKIHVVVTRSFLRSLANLDLAPSRVGALRAERPTEADGAGEAEGAPEERVAEPSAG
ncbi:MAG: hypothetical protein ACR2NV_08040 [Thermoleophilaceae bacterium]